MGSHTVREWADAEEWFNQYGALLGKYSLVFSNLFFALSLSTIPEKTCIVMHSGIEVCSHIAVGYIKVETTVLLGHTIELRAPQGLVNRIELSHKRSEHYGAPHTSLSYICC